MSITSISHCCALSGATTHCSDNVLFHTKLVNCTCQCWLRIDEPVGVHAVAVVEGRNLLPRTLNALNALNAAV